MSMVKRQLEEQEMKRDKATAIALKADVLKSCEHHDEAFGGGDVVQAYKLGNARWDKDSLGDTFKDRREMTDTIKEVVEDAPLDCPQCSRLGND